ncbi:MAG: DNA adenine methylase [Bilophila sp.]
MRFNPNLIGLYETLRREGERFIERFRALFTPENNTREAFLRLRAAFNASTDAEERAVLFLYLNRHAYNGLVAITPGASTTSLSGAIRPRISPPPN